MSRRSLLKEGFLRRLISVVALLALCGCETMSYYLQAAGGHLSLVSRAQKVDVLLADKATPQPLREPALVGAIVLCCIATLVLGIYPAPFIEFAKSAMLAIP